MNAAYDQRGEDELLHAIRPEALGSAAFRREHRLRYAYVAGAMYKGIASEQLVTALGKAGLLSFFGTGGLGLPRIEAAIDKIQTQLAHGEPYGMNLLASDEALQSKTVSLYLARGVQRVEAAAFMDVSPSLVRYRLHGLRAKPAGAVEVKNHIIAKVSRPEVAAVFMKPAPPNIVAELLRTGAVSAEEARLSQAIPLAQDICVEADSGGHTDQGVAFAITPAIRALRDSISREHRYASPLRVGMAGGLGTPDAIAAAFMLGADFVVTGSINQCTVEADTSDTAKEMLQDMNVQDTGYAPAGDMFELGARIQVLKKGVFFPTRANKLYQLYVQHLSIEEIDESTRTQIQEKYFRRSFDEVWDETRRYYKANFPQALCAAERNPKQKMALIFRWYFVHTNRLARAGDPSRRVDFQIHTGPALGAFNQWVKGGPWENWRARRVADIGERLMREAASITTSRLRSMRAVAHEDELMAVG